MARRAHGIVMVVALGAALLAADSRASGWKPTAVEVAKLPQYCWGQFNPELSNHPDFPTTTRLCGPGMNHFCPGLVLLNRAQSAVLERAARRDALTHAKMEIDYTLKRTPDSCPLRADVDAAVQRVRILEKVLR